MEQASSLYQRNRKLRLYKSTEQDGAIASYVPSALKAVPMKKFFHHPKVKSSNNLELVK
ncbi:MAG: hypothetical protein F6K31_12385 [Symploca sp. SIO2G7]|nr:hypothetical protein [Symploca sp. SIO2G7]